MTMSNNPRVVASNMSSTTNLKDPYSPEHSPLERRQLVVLEGNGYKDLDPMHLIEESQVQIIKPNLNQKNLHKYRKRFRNHQQKSSMGQAHSMVRSNSSVSMADSLHQSLALKSVLSSNIDKQISTFNVIERLKMDL